MSAHITYLTYLTFKKKCVNERLENKIFGEKRVQILCNSSLIIRT